MTVTQPFVHEALLYASEEEFLGATVPFVNEGVEAGEPVLIVVRPEREQALRVSLRDSTLVSFADMIEIGRNPSRIIPVWHQHVADSAAHGGRCRGIGEPVWPGRTEAELAECHRHEALLNLAFADTPGFRLLCPYDTAELDPQVIERACCTHPYVETHAGRCESDRYLGLEAATMPFDERLADPDPEAHEFALDRASLPMLRNVVWGWASAAGIDVARTADVVLAVHELATNTLRHGEGRGTVRAWKSPSAFVFEVHDGGRIDDPLAGRRRPVPDAEGGRGLWLVNQLCDLVELRSSAAGTVVRMQIAVRG